MLAIAYMFAATAAAAAQPGSAVPAKPAPHECYVGVYRLSDGTLVDIAPEGQRLRWRMLDGRTGHLSLSDSGQWTSFLGVTRQPDGIAVSFGRCGEGTITFETKPGRAVDLHIVDTKFERAGTTFAGRLVLPKGTQKVALIVAGHGSERSSALVHAFQQRLYPAAGVGVFVYDKRGTGQSGGTYTQGFEILAADAAAAFGEAKRLAGDRASRVGFQGGSQAGWVLPLAAHQVPADFVIVGYGIAASPLVEDRNETLGDLSAAGWGSDVLAKAAEVTDATGAVVASRFTAGFDRLKAVLLKYGHEPWIMDLGGEFTGEVVKSAMAYAEEVLRVEGPKRDGGTNWTFDAMASLRKLRTPLLWLIAAEDSEGPGPETKANLLSLRAEGKPVTIAVFPETEHGIHRFRVNSEGKRVMIGYAPDFFPIELEFARTGRIAGNYPRVELHHPVQRQICGDCGLGSWALSVQLVNRADGAHRRRPPVRRSPSGGQEGRFPRAAPGDRGPRHLWGLR